MKKFKLFENVGGGEFKASLTRLSGVYISGSNYCNADYCRNCSSNNWYYQS